MAKSNIIGVDEKPKGKACAHCGEKTGIAEFLRYQFKIESSLVHCGTCSKASHLNPTENKTYVLLRLFLAWGFGLLLAGPAVYYIVRTVYVALFTEGEFVISAGPTAASFVGGIILGRYINHVMEWIGGSLSRIEDLPMMDFISGKATIQSDEER